MSTKAEQTARALSLPFRVGERIEVPAGIFETNRIGQPTATGTVVDYYTYADGFVFYTVRWDFEDARFFGQNIDADHLHRFARRVGP